MENKINNQSIQQNTDQLIRHYKVPVGKNKEEVLNTIFQTIDTSRVISENSNPGLIHINWRIVSVAASATIIVLLYFLTATVTLTENMTVNSYRLPDDSRIVLENESELSYNRYFWNRNVKLNGTAYFEVEKGSKFSVKTKLGDVKVLGTRFLVNETKEKMTVECYEGRVEARINAHAHLVDAGYSLHLTKEHVQSDAIENGIEFPEFAKFNRTFKKEKLEVVAKELSNFFGKEIVLQNHSVRYFTGTINTGKLESAMDIVCVPMQLHYKLLENKIIITNQK